MKIFLLLAAATVAWTQTAPPPPPASRVFIYQERIRGLRGNPIFCDGIEVATLRQRWSYFWLHLPPGEHVLTGRHKENQIVLDVVAGQDYYLRLDQVMSYPGSEKLVRNSVDDGRRMVESGKLQPINSDDVRDRARVSLK